MNEAGSPRSSGISGGGPLDYPDHRVIGAVKVETLGEVVPALIEAGFAPIGILAGEAGLRRLQATGGGEGISGLLRRFTMSLGADLDYNARAEQALQSGYALVDVEVNSEEAKHLARDVFVRHGAQAVTYFHPWAIETLA